MPERFPLLRKLPWDDDIKRTPKDNRFERSCLRPGNGEPPDVLFGIDNLKHKDQKILSLIDIPLWNKAKWRATFYGWCEHAIPMIALGFEDSEAAQQIFKELRGTIGAIDEKEQLRVSVITGIDKTHPPSYTVIVSTNLHLNQMNKTQNMRIIIVSRMNRMQPADSRNLDAFLEEYRRFHKYVILPAVFVDTSTPPRLFWELRIEKKELTVRPAWQIGENDPDVVAIGEENQPIIPDDVKDPPVTHALQRFAKFRQRNRR